MKKKIVIGCIGLVFMLLAISFGTAVDSNISTKEEKTVSPLYQIRTNSAIRKKINDIRENIKINFLEDKLFFSQFSLFRNDEQIKILYTAQCNSRCLLTAYRPWMGCTTK